MIRVVYESATALEAWCQGPVGRAIRRGAAALLLVLGILAAVVHAWRVSTGANAGFNSTPSVPTGFYALYPPPRRPRRGSYVCLLGADERAPQSLRAAIAKGQTPLAWRHTALLKKIVAVAGDEVTYERNLVHVNGEPLAASTVLASDSFGQPLEGAQFPRQLHAGEVWLAAEHPRGRDSRYFGPVRVDALSCEGRPLWTF